jgi:hypothetical protein
MTPRSLSDAQLSLQLYDTPWSGNAPLGDVKARLGKTWRRSIRSVGGFWIGTADYDGPLFEMRDMFLYGLGREIRETLGGLITWQGFITQLDLTLNGLTYSRNYLTLANRVQAIYSRMGDNLLTNGSAESGIWAAVGAPATLLQSTAWVSDGVYSAHIVANANEGALIQTGIAIVAAQGYDVQLSAKLISGTWKLDIYRTDTNAVLGSTTTNTAGQQVLRCSISSTNTYAGNIGVHLVSLSAAAEIYADGASLRTSPIQARTAWLANTSPQGQYGWIENALLLAGMSDDAANAHAQSYLSANAWPRTVPPDVFGGKALGQTDGLVITFGGYAFEMRNKYTLYGGQTQNASVHVANLVGADALVTAGAIAANTMQYQIDDRAPLKNWDVIKAIILAGDTAGNRWNGGVYGGRLFNYGPASTTVDYHFRGGQLLDVSSGVVEPWNARPGMVYMDDMPAGPGGLSGFAGDDPRVFYIEEIEFDMAGWLAGSQGLSFRRRAT